MLLLALPGHNGRGFGAAGLGLGRKRGGDLNGGPAEAGVELVEALHEGAGLGVDEFGSFLKQAQLGLAGGFEAVEDDAGFDVGMAGLPETGEQGVGVADQAKGAAAGGGQGELRGTGTRRRRGAVTVVALLFELDSRMVCLPGWSIITTLLPPAVYKPFSWLSLELYFAPCLLLP